MELDHDLVGKGYLIYTVITAVNTLDKFANLVQNGNKGGIHCIVRRGALEGICRRKRWMKGGLQ